MNIFYPLNLSPSCCIFSHVHFRITVTLPSLKSPVVAAVRRKKCSWVNDRLTVVHEGSLVATNGFENRNSKLILVHIAYVNITGVVQIELNVLVILCDVVMTQLNLLLTVMETC